MKFGVRNCLEQILFWNVTTSNIQISINDRCNWLFHQSPSLWPTSCPLPHESGRGKMGKSERNPDAFTLYFAGTASIHFHKALSFVNMMSPSISVFFYPVSPPIDWNKIISVFGKNQPICVLCFRRARNQIRYSFSVHSLSGELREMKGTDFWGDIPR